ncbi:hypothetical protein MMG00_05370 [Ignatzschineria rhizosphaerae]|uniref:MFS transporter n=1 Tax=Ignatzschineria rhizosphaerae TaxID=2923279 RepID=A0ABY3X899_9GAMM|nr:hypothetical protein [Ignatzschineria rhizosphaerae]UNM97282.1 hypothetical protein MMG00_05370 [Ignatzschineria rhizosphaerae]
MELVLIGGLFGITVVAYIVSFFMLSKESIRKLWMALFLIVFIIAIGTLLLIHFNTDLLGTLKDMTEIYFAYFVITFLLILGVINIWVFKSIIWRVLRGKSLKFSDDDDN